MNQATKRGTRTLTRMAKYYGHEMEKFRHDFATVTKRMARSKCRGCGVEVYLYTMVKGRKSQVVGVGDHGIRKGCSA